MDKEDFEALKTYSSVKLKTLASYMNIKGYGGMVKSDLVKAITKETKKQQREELKAVSKMDKEANTPKRVEPVVVEKPALPKYQGIQVLKVLEDGRETATHYHCSMEGGITMHVPKTKFE